MKTPSFLRANEWWEFKIIPLLVVGYLTIIHYEYNLITHIGWLLFLIAVIAVGAIYVSIINDYTDLKFDLACGKPNRLEQFTPLKRKLLLFISILLAAFCCLFFINDIYSLSLYLAAYISFSLYSIPPFRFKNRGLLGIIADASGAHLFPSLFIVSSVTHKLGVETNFYFLVLIGVWSFTYGLRGILWHQFWDRKNDLSINHKTFATGMHVPNMKSIELVITCIETGTLILILLNLGELLPFIALLFYIPILLSYPKIKYHIILILSKKQPWHVFMSDYYEILLPFSLIITCSFEYPACATLIIFHIIFFPVKLKLFIKNLLLILNLRK